MQQPDHDVRLLRRIREVGPFEDWYGRSRVDSEFPRRLMVRRLVNLEKPSRKVWAERFESVADAADRVGHPNAVASCGTLPLTNELALAFEYIDGLDLQACVAKGFQISMVTSVWLLRQVFSVLRHAQSVGIEQLELRLATVWIRRTGEVLVDPGFPLLSLSGSRLTQGIVDNGLGLLRKLHSSRVIMGEIPREVDSLLSPAKPLASAREVDDELARIFYRCLGGEDDVDGRMPLARWMAKHHGGEIETPVPSTWECQGKFIEHGGPQAWSPAAGPVQSETGSTVAMTLTMASQDSQLSSSVNDTLIIRFREYIAGDLSSKFRNAARKRRILLQRFISFLIGFILTLLVLTWVSSLLGMP
ncbi:MAG: hypothetical protein KTR25_10430 [Myxococcales bacterium]|nr:hypothetical protein [Myxococcales bacterium]